MPIDTFTCADCAEQISVTIQSSVASGYATNADNMKVCYSCCAEQDRAYMIEHGRITLYDGLDDSKYNNTGYITNWADTLRFRVLNNGLYGHRHYRTHHNIARYAYHRWFIGPDRHIWHGVRYGDNTQLIHCKRTKRTVK